MLAAIVTGAGSGRRFGGEKILAPVCGEPLLFHTLRRMRRIEGLAGMVLVLPPVRVDAIRAEYGVRLETLGVTSIVAGGSTRQDSVENGLSALPAGTQLVLVHDAVRPVFSVAAANRAVAVAGETGAAILAVPARDTLKRVGSERTVLETVERGEIWRAETPQVAHYDLLVKAYRKAASDGFTGTDEASLLEHLGVAVAVVEGEPFNVKVTEPGDLAVVAALISGAGED